MLPLSSHSPCQSFIKPFRYYSKNKKTIKFATPEDLKNFFHPQSTYESMNRYKALTQIKNNTSFESLFSEATSVIQSIWDNKDGVLEASIECLAEEVKIKINERYPIKGELLLDILKKGNEEFHAFLPELIKNSGKNELEKIDKHGWSLLHWAVFQKKLLIIEALLEKNISFYKDFNGISVQDLALFTMDRNLIGRLNPEKNIDEILLRLPKTFHRKMMNKFERMTKKDSTIFHTCFYGLVEKAMPDIYALSPQNSTVTRFTSLYYPSPLNNKTLEVITPMGLAILNQNLNEVSALLDNGWSDLVEEHLVRKRWCTHQRSTENCGSQLAGMEETESNFNFFEDALELLKEKDSSFDDDDFVYKLENWNMPRISSYENYY